MSDVYFGGPQLKPSEELMHYGVKYKSGRYPYGSGDIPYQHDPGFEWGEGKRNGPVPESERNKPQQKPKVISIAQANKRKGGFQAYVNDLRSKGFTDKEIADSLKISINEMKETITAQELSERYKLIRQAQQLYSETGNKTEVARKMGISEGTVRNYLKEGAIDRPAELMNTAEMIRNVLKDNISVDIGKGIAQRLNMPQATFDAAVHVLELEGYQKVSIKYKQQGGNQAVRLVLAKPGEEWKNVINNSDKAYLFKDTYTEDGGKTWGSIEFPVSVSLDRVMVRYRDEGGNDRDGLIEIRPGVKDLDMGSNQYAQVRIAVDGDKYMKGMAVYNSDMPPGVDIIYNSKRTPEQKDKVFKDFHRIEEGPHIGEIDKDNPFGSSIKANEYNDDWTVKREVGQRHYIDPETGERKLSAINIVNESGDWNNWSRNLPSQFLSKQSRKLIKTQLDLTYAKRMREFDELNALTNPEIKKKLLMDFADNCDSAATHLKALALPRQSTHVIIPVPELKDDEIYAPNFKDGEIVSLVRFPHEGIYQIPTLRVNNQNQAARKLMGTHPIDAVCINKHVADQLSGADFDGDTVMVLPNPGKKVIESRPYLEGLVDFDTGEAYPAYPGMKKVGTKQGTDPETGKSRRLTYDGFNKGLEMGKISNLITDMTLAGAPDDELVRATKHSMVIIDAEKHNLNWKQSEIDNNIAELKEKYQGGKNRGAGTLISRSTKDVDIVKRLDYKIDPETGKKIWRTVNPEDPRSYQKKKIVVRDPQTGEKISETWVDTNKLKTQKVSMMETVDDAYKLSSGTDKEALYADYANKLKALANDTRKIVVHTPNTQTNEEAKRIYKKEYDELKEQLNKVLADKPLERKAQALKDAIMKVRKKENPQWDTDDYKKHEALALQEARDRLHYKRYRFSITPRQWEAIMNGGISSTLIKAIFEYADKDELKKLALPKDYKPPKMTTAEIALARTMLNNYTQSQVAERFNVSVSTLNRLLNE